MNCGEKTFPNAMNVATEAAVAATRRSRCTGPRANASQIAHRAAIARSVVTIAAAPAPVLSMFYEP